MSALRVDIVGGPVEILADRALHVPSSDLLAVSDLHLGKSSTFRRAGIPVPEGADDVTLARLSRSLDGTRCRRLVIAGDLCHSVRDGSWERFVTWRLARPSLDVVLVRGNHDILAPSDYAEAGLRVTDEERVGDLLFVHDAGDAPRSPGLTVVSGHVHPAVRLHGPGGDTATCPCFLVGHGRVMMPAFGEFTGSFVVTPRAGDEVFVPIHERVIRIEARVTPPPSRFRRRRTGSV